jgi:hypothetical protein
MAAHGPVRAVPRTVPGITTILTPAHPTVTLTRLQSGIGALKIALNCAPSVGDVRFGAAYELTDSTSGVVPAATAPPADRRSPVSGAAGGTSAITIDLRQSRRLRRLAVYVFSDSGRPITWSGTVTVSTAGGARVDVPLEYGMHQGPVVALSLYNVEGEYALRAERELILGDVREATRAFGYERIGWMDARTALE